MYTDDDDRNSYRNDNNSPKKERRQGKHHWKQQRINRTLRYIATGTETIAKKDTTSSEDSNPESGAVQTAQRETYRAGRQLRQSQVAKQTKAAKQAEQPSRAVKKHPLKHRFHIRSVVEHQHGAVSTLVRFVQAPFQALRAAFHAIHTIGSVIMLVGGIIMLVGILVLALTLTAVASPMAITHASDVGAPYIPLSESCAAIDMDAQDKLDDIRTNNPHDAEELTGSFTSWPELLSVFAVHMTTRRDGRATDVAAFDDNKVELLREFYWNMNRIDHRVEVRGSDKSSTRVLIISIDGLTFDGMMDKLQFDDEQRRSAKEVLEELSRNTLDTSHIVYSSAPGAPIGDGSYAALIKEAEKHLGAPYRLGTTNAPYEFDCGYFVQYVFNQSGVAQINVRRATQLFYLCEPVSPADAAPGDLVFFHGTYDTPTECSHVGIYVGNNTMIHSGSPVKYSRIDTPYWKAHFYAFGRLSSFK